MHVTEEYRGFRIEAEAEPIAASVSVRIFALEKDGSFAPDVEPMNVQTFESSGQAGTAELIHDSLAYARSAIDDLFNGNFDNDDGERPRHELSMMRRAENLVGWLCRLSRRILMNA